MKDLGRLLPLLILLTACKSLGPTSWVSQKGKQVSVVERISSKSRTNIEKLGEVSCEIPDETAGYKNNLQKCENYMRNEAADKGGDILLIAPKDQVVKRKEDWSDPYNARLVKMKGVIYKTK